MFGGGCPGCPGLPKNLKGVGLLAPVIQGAYVLGGRLSPGARDTQDNCQLREVRDEHW
jgi:hypothetical protein